MFCKEPLKIKEGKGRRTSASKKAVLEHLDNNHDNNNYWNVTLVHRDCNQRKRTNGDYQIIAREKIVENKKYVPLSPDHTSQVGNKNVRTGNMLHNLVKEYLERKLPNTEAPALDVDDVCDELAYIAQEKHRCGSQPTMKRHIFAICRGSKEWEITYDGGVPIVFRQHPFLLNPIEPSEAEWRRALGGPAQVVKAQRGRVAPERVAQAKKSPGPRTRTP